MQGSFEHTVAVAAACTSRKRAKVIVRPSDATGSQRSEVKRWHQAAQTIVEEPQDTQLGQLREFGWYGAAQFVAEQIQVRKLAQVLNGGRNGATYGIPAQVQRLEMRQISHSWRKRAIELIPPEVDLSDPRILPLKLALHPSRPAKCVAGARINPGRAAAYPPAAARGVEKLGKCSAFGRT